MHKPGAENELTKEHPVYFVGAGPGDPELITVKGRKLLNEADVIIFTGSLVPTSVLSNSQAKIYNSAGMHLDQIMDILVGAYRQGKKVVRLHTGDPSLYSAIAEQIAHLKKHSIPYKVIPGVTAGFAASASLACELTIPEKVQTVIISRVSGRTPVPEKESLQNLSRIRASLILYLSVARIRQVTKELLKGYPEETPVAVVEKATWPEERIITGTLSDIASKVEEAGIKKTAVILVGEALKGISNPESLSSKLYHKGFSHGYRSATASDKDLIEAFSPEKEEQKELSYIVYLGEKGKKIAEKLIEKLKDSNKPHPQPISFSLLREQQVLEQKWKKTAWIIFVGACQIAVRTIAPFIENKYLDPAVLAVDESAQNVICLLSGHLGGGNQLTKDVAEILGVKAVVTTQSDLMDLPPLDLWARKNGLVPESKQGLKEIQALFRDKEKVKVFLQEYVTASSLPKGFVQVDRESDADISIGPFTGSGNTFQLVTRNIHLGTGCHKDYLPQQLIDHAESFLVKYKIHPFAVKNVCTIDKKAKEPAIVELAHYLNAELTTFPASKLNKVPDIDTSHAVLKAVGAGAVSEPAALLCSKSGKLLVKKQKYQGCTFSLAINRVELKETY